MSEKPGGKNPDKDKKSKRLMMLDSANASATELPWESKEFQLEGSVTRDKVITDSTTAPTVTVTWSWVDPSANAAPSIATTTYNYTSGTAVEIPVDLGTGNLAATGITSVTFENNGATTTLPSIRWSYNEGKLIFSSEYCTLLNDITRVHTITFNDAVGTQVEVTLSPQS